LVGEKQMIAILKHKTLRKLIPFLLLALIVGGWLAARFDPPESAHAAGMAVAGRLIDEQGVPVRDVEVSLFVNGQEEPVDQSASQPDGSYLLFVPTGERVDELRIQFERPHFWPLEWTPTTGELEAMVEQGSFVVDDIVLVRRLGIGFWVATVTFVAMLILIATERLHKTLAALLAVAVIFGVSFVGGAVQPELFIFDFEQALEYVDFDVIFLLMGMMIVIAIIEETGVFQWLAFQAYRLSQGKIWLLTVILMAITALSSAMLDNVTTMLLMTPITLQIALAVGIDPLSLLLPEVLASNVGGISTLIGTPTNILIGSYAGLGFNDFVVNLTPGVILSLIGLTIYTLLRYRKEHREVGEGLSTALMQRLEENAQIEDSAKLIKAGIVFAVLLVLFIFGEAIHLVPAVSAIIGAVAMLIWVHPDIEEMLAVVDWTTLMFFIGLFMVIGAVQEVGLISLIAVGIGSVVGESLVASILVVAWMAALLSGVVDNIPFAAAMLPVVNYLTGTVPGAESMVLFYALSIGAAMGGNSSLIGASANLVTAGIAGRAGYPITFKKFMSVGLPSVLVTVALGCIWLFIRF
jgi:Na+/H+ antiporter NhaD/arsenite permease-like protein